jgi:hypothetical protein
MHDPAWQADVRGEVVVEMNRVEIARSPCIPDRRIAVRGDLDFFDPGDQSALT